MFFFNRRNSSYTDFSEVAVDMHSHLVPGVDDGARDVADSLVLIEGLKELGFSHLITTPHTLQDIHPNTQTTLTEAFKLLDGKLPTGITIDLSSEYYLDEHFSTQLNDGLIMPLQGNRLLVEFSQIVQPPELEEVIFDLGIKGYQVVLAHPERYLFFHRQFDYYKRLKEMGLEFQVNALSLTRHYGEHIKKIAEKLIDSEMIDFIGTDLHYERHLEVLKKVPEVRHFTSLMKSGMLKNNLLLPGKLNKI
jgi:protein-tyrosine phosphatase